MMLLLCLLLLPVVTLQCSVDQEVFFAENYIKDRVEGFWIIDPQMTDVLQPDWDAIFWEIRHLILTTTQKITFPIFKN